MNFETWWNALPLTERPFGTMAKLIAVKAWNAGVDATCDYIGEIEGTAFGADKELIVLSVDGYEL